MRTFSTLTRDQNIVSLILNSVIQNRASDSVSQRPQDQIESTNSPWLRSPSDALDPINHPSIFGSNGFKPALGRSFAHCVDFHILLGRIPKRPTDSRLMDVMTVTQTTRPEMVNIAEVILDRWENRTGLWAGFRITNGSEVNGVD